METKLIDFWPEYGQNGKEETTILHCLNHQVSTFDHDDDYEKVQAGIPFTNCGPLDRSDVIDIDRMSRYFEEAVPVWKPGTQVESDLNKLV